MNKVGACRLPSCLGQGCNVSPADGAGIALVTDLYLLKKVCLGIPPIRYPPDLAHAAVQDLLATNLKA